MCAFDRKFILLVPVLLSGGSGSRLWPESRKSHPKQFTNYVSDTKSPLQQAILRLCGIGIEHSGWIVVGNEEHRFLLAEQLRTMTAPIETILLEPYQRDTSAAIALAAFQALGRHADPTLLIQTSDHWIADEHAFHQSIKRAIDLDVDIVTFGVKPTTPETGYGYIQTGEAIPPGYFEVECFVEKPDIKTAEKYLEAGNYVWNSGMFLLRARGFWRS